MNGSPILPGSTLGVIGGGQLGRLLALEARRMGYRVIVLDPEEGAPAAQVADEQICAPLDDPDSLLALARRSDVVTLEWENADVDGLRALPPEVRLHPSPDVLEIAQHRVREKETARGLGLPTAEYRAIASLPELRRALEELGTPAVLKTARMGYDGKGQATIRNPSEAEAAFAALASRPAGALLVLEGFIPFVKELSVVCARSSRGEIASFPAAENVHARGILDTSLAPARIPRGVADEVRRMAETLTERLGVVGLLAVEMFLEEDGTLRVNEIAPRPHNSGHYSWEACAASQFEQHIRAVCGLPLGDPALLRPAAAMANLLGEDLSQGLQGAVRALEDPGVALHLYGKRECRAGRKMGHLTVLADTPEDALRRVTEARGWLRTG